MRPLRVKRRLARGLTALWAGAALHPATAQPAPAPAPEGDGASQASPQPPVLFQPATAAMGPFKVTPRLTLVGGFNDNVNLSPRTAAAGDARPPVKSRYLTATPELSLVLPGDGIDRLELNLRLEATRFASSPINDADNGEASLDGLKLLDERTALAWRLTAQDWHDAVGSTDLSLQAREPDHFRAAALGAVLRHDSEDGEVRTEVEGTLSRKRYRNHREITRLGDADTRSLVVRRLWTGAAEDGTVQRWLGELRLLGTSYPGYLGTILRPLDNTDTRLLAGSLWEAADAASPLMTGSLKLGWQRKHSGSGRPGYNGFTWDAVLHLQLRPTTSLDLASGRAGADAPGDDANAVVINQQVMAWTELWKPDLRTTVSWVSGSNGYRYSPESGIPWRRDRVESVELGLRLDLRRDWQLGFNWSLATRRSSQEVFEYTRRLASVSLTVAL